MEMVPFNKLAGALNDRIVSLTEWSNLRDNIIAVIKFRVWVAYSLFLSLTQVGFFYNLQTSTF